MLQQVTPLAPGQSAPTPIGFLWLEITNQCNLQCGHCYADSGPYAGQGDRLVLADYLRLISESYSLGSREVQFIGGEPTLNRDLPKLIRHAAKIGYTFIEVFSNLTHLSDELVQCFVEHDVRVATSVYAPTADIHDDITHVTGSFRKTIDGIERLLALGVAVRAAIIEMDENRGLTEATIAFLHALGVENASSDRLRPFGRGGQDCKSELGELCGTCAGNTLCIGPDGRVSPCIMSKGWAVGSVLDAPLDSIAHSEDLSRLRKEIGGAVTERQGSIHMSCQPKLCQPYETCQPKWGGGPCEPTGCNPCRPKG